MQVSKEFLQIIEKIESEHLPPPSCDDEPLTENVDNNMNSKKLIIIFHDESTFHANDDQNVMWAEKGMKPVKPKSQGAGIMVSDFIEEYDGWLKLSDNDYKVAKQLKLSTKQEARVLLEIGEKRDGYWNNEKFMSQMKNAMKICKFKYPAEKYDVLWLFDQSSGHTKKADNALNVNVMNVKPGGKQPVLRDTIFKKDGKDVKQKMYFTESGKKVPKGLRLVLEERGYDVNGLNQEGLCKLLSADPDFAGEKSIVEQFILNEGHMVMFLPKLHCELNAIEQCWCLAKKHTRSVCNYSIVGLRKSVCPSLDTVKTQTIRKFIRKAREYIRAYREGHTIGCGLATALKQYKSH